jgi:hypothetical protein
VTCNALALVSQPQSVSISKGERASFSVVTEGTSGTANRAPRFQWKLNGLALSDGVMADGTEVSGSGSAKLSLDHVGASSVGNYTVTVTTKLDTYDEALNALIPENTEVSVTSAAASLSLATPIAITTSPSSLALNSGEPLSLSVVAEGTGPLAYQWKRNGVAIPGATSATYALDSAYAEHSGSYSVVVSGAYGSVESAPATVEITDASRLMALAVRCESGPGDEVLIVGVIVKGADENARKSVIIRGLGPVLAKDKLENYVRDPELRLYQGGTLIDSNDDWNSSAVLSELTRVGLSKLDEGSKDAVLLASLADGPYTVHLGVKTEARGIVQAEVYESDRSQATRLRAIAARAKAGTGENTLIGGFVVIGSGKRRVLIRGLGPSLAPDIGAVCLADPRLDLYSQGLVIKSNDDWGDNPELMAAFTSIQMAPLPSGSKDAAMIVELPPGPYSVHLTGMNGTTGIAMIEIYELP